MNTFLLENGEHYMVAYEVVKRWCNGCSQRKLMEHSQAFRMEGKVKVVTRDVFICIRCGQVRTHRYTDGEYGC